MSDRRPGEGKSKSIWYYDIKSHPPTDDYRKGWEGIDWSKKKKPEQWKNSAQKK